ncbi:MAG: PQQ-binding-like beta-propeller repeat protein [Acidimicrobiia bacterium]
MRARRQLVSVATAVAVSVAVALSAVGAGAVTQAPAPDDWAMPGHDLDNTRAATGSSIDASNVAQLQVAWKAPLGGTLSTAPLVVGDTVYVQDSSGQVTAVDRTTGAQKWHSESTGFNIGPFGVAVADGKVFAVKGSNGAIALDAATGAVLWTRELTQTPTEGIDIQPQVAGGTVYIATVPISLKGIYKGGDRGVLYALDAKTGATKWSFDTVQSPDLWGNPEINSGGGAWYPPAVDPAKHLVYWGVANPAPFPGTPEFPNGSSRPGKNLYTDSIVALDTRSGKLKWFHQVQPHDLFDRDQVHALVATVDGGTRVAISAGKGGVIVGLDPVTGKKKWQAKVGKHEHDDLTALSGPTTVLPGTFGGIETPPATADGVVYAAVVNAPVTLQPDQIAYFGAKMGQQPGEIAAVDAKTGKVLWSTEVPGDPLGGATVVNDLVLATTLQGKLVALDRKSGAIVTTIDLGGSTNGWPSVAGDLVIVPVGNGNPPQLVAYQLP